MSADLPGAVGNYALSEQAWLDRLGRCRFSALHFQREYEPARLSGGARRFCCLVVWGGRVSRYALSVDLDRLQVGCLSVAHSTCLQTLEAIARHSATWCLLTSAGRSATVEMVPPVWLAFAGVD